MKRQSSVAGYFYPGKAEALEKMIRQMTLSGAKKEKAIAAVCPHAGYEYSGPVAGAVYSRVEIPGTCIVLGPSHRPIESLFAIMREGSWVTPLGEVPLETSLADLIISRAPGVEEDAEAHRHEHSLEVQVPFIQFFRKEAAIVPVCVSHEASLADLEGLGKGMADAVREYGRDALIIASTDMSHYVTRKTAEKKDFMAIDRMLKLDPRGLHRVVEEENISMCGYQPATAALVAALELGARRAELVRYQTSGDRTGDYSEVVGYAGVLVI
ncbi:MAG: AmmeMemoRadiSam system protein B [Acidobacteriota bacterium]|nr:AmmeMemoRadiSam system protein B [Acidobacteriota bacterium]